MASLTSRALGFVKFSLAVFAIGGTSATVGGQAFDIASTLPGNLYGLIAGGVLGAILVPQVVKAIKDGAAGQERIDRLLTLTIGGALVLTVVLTFAAPALVFLYASGWSAEWLALSSAMAYWCLPQIFFYVVYAVLSQVLNAKSVFGWPAWAPAISNVVAIISLIIFLVFAPDGHGPVESWTPGMIALLCGGATLSIAVQSVVLLVPLKRVGFRFRPRWGVEGLGSASRTALWTFMGVAAGQVAYLAISNVSSRAGQELNELGIDGAGLNSYGYAFLLVFLPHGVATVSLATAMFTRLSQAAAVDAFEEVRTNLIRTSTLVSFICVGATVYFVVTGPLITEILWNTRVIGQVVQPLALGILGISQTYVFSRGLFAFHDGRGPFLGQVAGALVTATGSLLSGIFLPPEWVVFGVSLSSAAANTLSWAVVHAAMKTRIRRGLHAPVSLSAPRRFRVAMAASAAAALLVGWALTAWLSAGEDGTLWMRLIVLAVISLVMGGTYAGVSYLVGRDVIWRDLVLRRR